MTTPIVLFGGFMSFKKIYQGMCHTLEATTGRPVFAVPADPRDWIRLALIQQWGHLLRKVDQTVKKAIAVSTSGKVTLVGHSAGGVLARIYLGSDQFQEQSCPGRAYVERLVTLGSPHQNMSGLTGGWVSQRVNKYYPGAFFASEVEYISVSGRSIFGDPHGGLRERCAYPIYRMVAGQGGMWGDGIVPTDCALLPGARHVILDGVTHYQICGGPWYGTQKVIPGWWSACVGGN